MTVLPSVSVVGYCYGKVIAQRADSPGSTRGRELASLNQRTQERSNAQPHPKRERQETLRVCEFSEPVAEIHHPHGFLFCLQRGKLWLLGVPVSICCLFVISYISSIGRFAEQSGSLACILPIQATWFIPWSGRRSDWIHTAFSRVIPYGYGCASLNMGAVVAPKLTKSGINSVPPSTVLSNTGGACWSFRGTSGTFGIALDTPMVVLSHIAIRHWPSNSTSTLSLAPRQVNVWGLVDGKANMKIFSQSKHLFTSALAKIPPPVSKEGVFLPLAEIDYDITARSLYQVFPLYSEVLSLGIDFGVIVFDIRSNWGADVTSLCSVRVYGRNGTVLVE